MKLPPIQAIAAILLGFILVIGFGVMCKIKAAHSNPERRFTPEQREVLTALRNARADLENTRMEVEKAKRELNDMLTSARQAMIAKGMDPNVHVSWIDLIRDNNQPLVTCPNAQNQNVSIHWGFREDGLVTWKRP